MTFQCGDCRTCGKCYPKEGVCPQCGEAIVLDEMDECPKCKRPITHEMREAARRAFMQYKQDQYVALFPRAAKTARRFVP